MITHLHLESFKSFKSLDFELKPLNVVIGPNGSGKTNFLDFFRFLSEAMSNHLADAIYNRGGLWRLSFGGSRDPLTFRLGLLMRTEEDPEDPDLRIDLSYTCEIRPYDNQYEIFAERFGGSQRSRKHGDKDWDKALLDKMAREGLPKLSADATPLVSYPELALSSRRAAVDGFADVFVQDTRNIQWVSNSLMGPDAVGRRPSYTRSDSLLLPDGDNLSSVLHFLSNDPQHRETRERLLDVLRIAYPDFEDLSFRAPAQGQVILSWKDKRLKDAFDANFLSDGLLRFLSLLVVLLNPRPPSLILIDEPEVGLHPSLIGLIGELLVDASTRTQLIVATHSPQLLNELQKEHICVVETDKEGASTITRASEKPDIDAWLKNFTLGETWLQGNLGGKPW